MVEIINIIALVALVLGTLITLSGYKVVNSPIVEGEKIKVFPLTRFLTFSVMTSVIFLGPFSMLKYLWWILVLAFLCLTRFRFKVNGIIITYCAFILWAVISAIFVAPYKGPAINMVIKYTLPLAYLYLAYNAINDSEDLVFFLKRSTLATFVYLFLVGGATEKLARPVYDFFSLDTGLILNYGPFADFISSIFVMPLALYVITGKWRWLIIAGLCALSTLLANVRTGLGGIFLSTVFILLGTFKHKSMPWIAGVVVTSVMILFSVPELRQKMFVDQDLTISEYEIENTNFTTINSNNREYMWNRNLQKFYVPSPVIGSGLGIAVESMKRDNAQKPIEERGLELLHSDYVQFLCDLGIIGLALFIIFGVTTIIQIIRISWHRNNPFVLRLCGGMALGCTAAIFFSMSFDNIITYCQQSYVFPFIFIGILMRVKELVVAGKWDSEDE
ncbi:MAG: O-antigen ligase family protein [Muribaculaceae bacterium]|nr:O-antigen ligase family protein [Muribaculaceae bacterium]